MIEKLLGKNGQKRKVPGKHPGMPGSFLKRLNNPGCQSLSDNKSRNNG
jgi:hypothetical protein